ncbi:MAG: SDR family NAD(P)-dependent oxidoreductase, partial [Myxococcota bacterium]|nr:SDR family NAD(P)-dependent oxidoreductase [Myxococcota bacterium]
MELQGLAAIVTGGASGLGAATVRKLVAGGARVVVADLNREKGEAISAELGDAVVYQHVDVSSEEDVNAAMD